MPSSRTSTPELDIYGSKSQSHTESESHNDPETHTNLESDPDQEYIIENQLGLPDYQYGIYESSPPPVDPPVNCDALNDKGEYFSWRKVAELSFPLAKVDCKVEVSTVEGDGLNTEVVVSLSDKVRKKLSLQCCAYKKSLQKKTIKVRVEGSYLSNPTININIGQSQLRGTKNKRENEGVEETTEIHVQLKKTKL